MNRIDPKRVNDDVRTDIDSDIEVLRAHFSADEFECVLIRAQHLVSILEAEKKRQNTQVTFTRTRDTSCDDGYCYTINGDDGSKITIIEHHDHKRLFRQQPTIVGRACSSNLHDHFLNAVNTYFADKQ